MNSPERLQAMSKSWRKERRGLCARLKIVLGPSGELFASITMPFRLRLLGAMLNRSRGIKRSNGRSSSTTKYTGPLGDFVREFSDGAILMLGQCHCLSALGYLF